MKRLLALPVTRLAVGILLVGTLSSRPALAEWNEPSQLTYNTAYTLDRGQIEVGILSPLQYGISSTVQIGLHPIILLIGSPNVTLRWQAWRDDPVALALDFGANWSLLREEDELGNARTCKECGYPGRLVATVSLSWSVSREVMLTLGFGPAGDFLDFDPSGLLVEIHGSILWNPDPKQLIMLHVNGHVPILGKREMRPPTVQLTYARACGSLHVGVGLALGDFPIARELDRSESWYVYPVLDIWWRL